MNKHKLVIQSGFAMCPKCGVPTITRRFCNGGCWDDMSLGMDGTEHIHWSCYCNYEWLTLCADHTETDARL